MEKIKEKYELKKLLSGNDIGQKIPRTLFKDGFPVVCPFKPPVAVPTQTGVQIIQGFCTENCSRFELWGDKDPKTNKDIFFVVTTCNGINPETKKPIRIPIPLQKLD